MDVEPETINRLRLPPIEDLVQCPSCDAALKPYEIAKHCEEEMEQLKEMHSKTVSELPTTGAGDGRNAEPRKPWTVFRKVQKNRQSRQKQRSRKRTLPQEHNCPVCNHNFPHDEIQRHAEQCLRRSNCYNDMDNSDGDSDEATGEAEEYEWAGQKRIRASSLLQGGYASLGLGTIITNHNTDEDEDLNVDEDDTQIYGPPQFAENDVIPPTINVNGSDEDQNVATYMRRLIGGNANTTAVESSQVATLVVEAPLCDDIKYLPTDMNERNSSVADTPAMQVIESLKAKLRHYENHIQNKFKCLICLDDYRNPAISVSCWHVHCEECWLRSLGARKLCPQCNLITSPKDLRRIYM